MKFKLLTICNPKLQTVMQERVELKLSYRMSKILRIINPELKKIEDKRNGLVEIYADTQTEEEIKDHKPKNVTVKVKEFMDEFNLFLGQEIELDIQKIPFELLDKNLKLSGEEFHAISDFVELPG